MRHSISDDDLSISHLQLSPRAENALRENGVLTVRDFRAASFEGRDGVGKLSIREIAHARQQLVATTTCDGHVNWDAYREGLPHGARNIAITSKALTSLSRSARSLGIGALHLRKPFNPLQEIGVNTIGQLVDGAREGIGKLENFGGVARSELIKCLCSLSRSVRDDGTIDWMAFASAMELAIVPPAEMASEFAPRVILGSLHSVIEEGLQHELDKRGLTIFKKRLLSPADQQPTLEEMGQVFGVTRERVRQLEASAVDILRRSLLHEDYRGLSFRFRPEVGQFFRDAAMHFVEVALPAWTRSRWLEELARCWGVTPSELLPHLTLLAELLSYEQSSMETRVLEPLFTHSSTAEQEVRRICTAAEAIHEALRDEPLPVDGFELANRIKSRLPKGFRISLDDIPELAELCSSVEVIGEDEYCARFENLTRAGQVIRILAEHGEPLHHAELLREINKRDGAKDGVLSRAAMVSRLAQDDRVVAIGKSGQWALAEWGAETRSIVTVIEEVLHRAGEAMSELQIWEAVTKLRQASEKSIPMLLQSHPKQFRKVALTYGP